MKKEQFIEILQNLAAAQEVLEHVGQHIKDPLPHGMIISAKFKVADCQYEINQELIK